jgi:serine-type D-Ala-D-Ala carboxypeptidase/endopeptidase
MIKNQMIATLCCLTLFSGVHAFTQENTIAIETSMSMNIQKILQEYLEDNGTPGAAVGLIDHGKVQFFCCGKMALDGRPVTEDTLFEIGSITKVFTTLALMDMCIKKEVQLDDPIEKYLPGVKVPELAGKKITFRHLATHTSGMPRMPDNFSPEDPSNPYQDYTVECLYNYLQSCTLKEAPGESCEYSNVGMGLLGHILSIRSGKSYEELIQSLIAKQLNMPDTSISIAEEMTANFADGHHLQQAVGHWDLAPAFAGAGALRSNIKDMTNFLAANMGVIESSLNDVLQQCHEQQPTPAPQFSIGLGWVLSNSNSADMVWHNGGTGGFRSYLGFNRKTQQGVVILSNSTEDWPDEFGRLMLDPDYQRPIVDKTLAGNPEYLNKFSGSYEAVLSDELPKQQLQISVFGKLLTSALSSGEVGMLYPESYGVFRVKGFPDGKVIFSFDDSGNISKVEARLISNGTILWQATPTIKM